MKITNPDEPNSNLKQALENLEIFVRQIEKELVPNLSHLDVLEGKLIALPTAPLKKRIGLAYQNIISPHLEKKSAVLDEILHSSDIIKSYFPLIQVMEEGTPEQKKFAAYAKGAIERYNHALDGAANQPPSWQQKIVCFIYEKSGLLIGNRLVKIDLPQKAYLHIDFPQPFPNNTGSKKNYCTLSNESIAGAAEKISYLRELVIPAFQVQQQTLELYYMKIIALLENKLFSKVEARSLVLKTPTNILLDKEAQRVTISQRLVPLPGQLVEVSATFLMDKRTLNFSIFQSDNFSNKSTQTGFPYPSQHDGWALPEILIPKYLHRPERLKHFPDLFQIKGQIAQALLPKGSLVEKAGMFLRKKRQTFEEHKSEFVSYHKNLAIAIADASTDPLDESHDGELDHTKDCIDNFFEVLTHHSTPYDFLSETHYQIMHKLITLPHTELEKAWIRGEIDNLDVAQNFLDNEMKNNRLKWLQEYNAIDDEVEKSTLKYSLAMSDILSLPVQQLILQQNSEIMRNPPPTLSLFAKKLQIALYLQLWEFQHELSLDPQETDIFCRLSRLLEDDITLFKSPNFASLPWTAVAVSAELETYYMDRNLNG